MASFEGSSPQLTADGKSLLQACHSGLPPPQRLAARCLVGLDTIFQAWKHDFETYVADGGSLLRIVVGESGSGKTHLGDALKATAAEQGFLVCQIDTQAQHTNGDDLLLYSAFCLQVTVPRHYLGESGGSGGLRSVLDDVAGRLDGKAVRDLLRPVNLPKRELKNILAELVDASRDGRLASNVGWQKLLAVVSGERVAGYRSLAALKANYPNPFLYVNRMPGKRDARLWLESLLLALPKLGFPGVLIVLDEHDDTRKKSLEQSIVQLRQKLDRLAEGHLPGCFVLYLVLDDFPERVREAHAALEQRIEPIIRADLSSRLMARLSSLRDLKDTAFLEAVSERLHSLILGIPIPAQLAPQVTALARQHSSRLGGVNTRAFVKGFVQLLDV